MTDAAELLWNYKFLVLRTGVADLGVLKLVKEGCAP